MSKKGRKRKTGARYPSGDIKPEASASPPTQIRRILSMAESGALDASLATPLGWLRLHKSITDRHFTAGAHLAQLVGQHDRVMGMPRRSTKAPSYERGFGSGGGGHAPEQDPELVANVRRRFETVMSMLRVGDPTRKLEMLMVKVCVEDVMPDWSEKVLLLIGLDLLILHFRIDGARQAPARRVQEPTAGQGDADRDAWLALMREEFPDLPAAELERDWHRFVAAKRERERLRQGKERARACAQPFGDSTRRVT